MTSTLPRQSRSNVVRTIASTLCFSDPPVMKNLGKAREAATSIYEALVAAGIVAPDPNDAEDDGSAAGDGLALFAPNGAATVPAEDSDPPAADPES